MRNTTYLFWELIYDSRQNFYFEFEYLFNYNLNLTPTFSFLKKGIGS